MRNKLLIITQKVNKDDQILGFFHRWIEEFAKHYEKVTVICLEQGIFSLPSNVKILSLGKEKKIGRIKYLFNFYKYIWQERKNYGSVFVHMNPIYIILGGLYWHLEGKKIALWYTHKQVDLKLKIAEKLTDTIFSASVESFRLPSSKLVVTGHGIDTDLFRPQDGEHEEFVILSVGRLAKTKNHHLLIEALAHLPQMAKPWKLLIIGGAIYPEDFIYQEDLLSLIKKFNLEDRITMTGSILPSGMVEYYQSADLLVNLSDTGSLDKVVLEAMACGLSIVSCNEAFAKILSKDLFVEKDPTSISLAIVRALALSTNSQNRDYIVANHNLVRLIDKIRGLL